MIEGDFEFSVGDAVEKIGGDYTFIGVVISAFVKLSGAQRYAVEDDRGVVHIYSGKNLKLAERTRQENEVDLMRATLRQIELACDKRAKLMTPEVRCAFEGIPGMLEVNYDLDRALRVARTLCDRIRQPFS